MRRLRRVYFDYELTPVIELDENQSRKLKTVLRAEQGDIVEVLTKEYLAEGEIYIAGKKGVQVRILKKRPVCIPDYKFIVYQCIAKREYMDFIIEKSYFFKKLFWICIFLCVYIWKHLMKVVVLYSLLFFCDHKV